LSRWRDEAVVAAYKLGSRAAAVAPASVARLAGRAIGRGLAYADGDRRALVASHLGRITGRAPTRREVQAAFDSYARYWVELFELPSATAEALDAGITVEGLEHLDAALAAGTGAVVALPHVGGWEWGGAWLASQGRPMTVVAEPLEPPALFEWFVGQRRRLGMTVVPMGAEASGPLMGALRANRVVGLVCDRDIAGGGVEVELFGERTTMPAGPVTMALRTGAPLLPAAVYFEDDDAHRAVVRPPLELTRTGRLRDDVTRLTQVLAYELEGLIRAAPEQWHVFQPFWPSDRHR
jgi:KDO2-lipid IV(A) lauroyltransferase